MTKETRDLVFGRDVEPDPPRTAEDRRVERLMADVRAARERPARREPVVWDGLDGPCTCCFH